jgi:hypothetical protein
MSGLDDFNWSVNEPSLKPHPAMMDATGVTFKLNPGDLDSAPPPFQPEMEVSAPPELPPLGSELDLDPPTSEESSLSLNLPPASTLAASPTDFYHGGNAPSLPPGMPGMPGIPKTPAMSGSDLPPQFDASMEASVFALSQTQMEDMIRKQFQETFQQMAQKMLPDLAERLIKHEIHKMLSES